MARTVITIAALMTALSMLISYVGVVTCGARSCQTVSRYLPAENASTAVSGRNALVPPQIAVALANAFGVGVNELPLSLVLSWYEQKAVSILLTLLHLGIKNIKLGPSLPAFVTPNVLGFLVQNFNIAPTTTAEADLKQILG